MIKNILFDMGGVIFIQDTATAFERFKAAGIDTDYYMSAHGQKDFMLDFETGRIDTDEFCRRMAGACGRESIGIDEVRHCWLGFVREVPTDRLHTLLQLKERYHLGLLTNTNPIVMGHCDSPAVSEDGLPLSHYFDSLFRSYEMGLYKPDPAIFIETLRRDGMLADETLFVDDAAKNIDAARAVGMHALHVPTNEDWRPALAKYLEANS